MTEIEQKVADHDLILSTISTSIKSITDTLNENTRAINTIAENMGKIEVLFEKLASIEERSTETTKRIFSRLELIERTQNTSGCTALLLSNKDAELRSKEMEYLKDKVKRVDKDLDHIKNLPNQILWRVVTAVTILLTTAGISAWFGLK